MLLQYRHSPHQSSLIFSLTQRPTESDKTAIGNATIFRTGRLKRLDDRKMVAKELDVPLSELLSE
ncbi:hypothetical protein HQQ94_12680 [Shewanella sp. VB17]|uniref:hypothetical protein n=1 Tax=Shewanella sp. VB17 TaxID=2739432 RepID=UPI001564AEA8|nr:hypothetical protein [Shewanella sp. VB17]NRD74075.1 hypothetical protein [Shewanella sp. VB17]